MCVRACVRACALTQGLHSQNSLLFAIGAPGCLTAPGSPRAPPPGAPDTRNTGTDGRHAEEVIKGRLTSTCQAPWPLERGVGVQLVGDLVAVGPHVVQHALGGRQRGVAAHSGAQHVEGGGGRQVPPRRGRHGEGGGAGAGHHVDGGGGAGGRS